MSYVHRRSRDSMSFVIPALLAAGSAALLAIVWRRAVAPRSEHRIRRKTDGAATAPNAPAGPGAVPHEADTQPAHTGAGTLFHRRYEVVLTGTGLSPADALALMHRNITELAPSTLARFDKSTGHDARLRVGDEYEINMLGPWNGMVRVSESSPDHFTLVTLDGHPEAGHITFRVSLDADSTDSVRVQIESWARSRDSFVAAVYDKLRIGKQIQTETWITFLQRFSALAGMTTTPEVQIITEEMCDSAPDAYDTPRGDDAHG